MRQRRPSFLAPGISPRAQSMTTVFGVSSRSVPACSGVKKSSLTIVSLPVLHALRSQSNTNGPLTKCIALHRLSRSNRLHAVSGRFDRAASGACTLRPQNRASQHFGRGLLSFAVEEPIERHAEDIGDEPQRPSGHALTRRRLDPVDVTRMQAGEQRESARR
jgi:hypothetical protein